MVHGGNRWVNRWMGGWVGEKDVEKAGERVLWRKGESTEGRRTWDQGTHAIATTLKCNNARSTTRSIDKKAKKHMRSVSVWE